MYLIPTLASLMTIGLFGQDLPTTQSLPPIQVRTVYFSQCSDDPLSKEESIQYIYNSGKLLLIHNNAWLNCAAIDATIKALQQGNQATFIETPSFATKKYDSGATGSIIEACSCYFTIIYEVSNVPKGNYRFTTDNLHGVGTSPSVEIQLSKATNETVFVRTIRDYSKAK